MLHLTPHHRLLLAVKPVDFRRGIDGLAAACQLVLDEQPLSGTVFVFTNCSRTAVKILVYDGHGYWRKTLSSRSQNGKVNWNNMKHILRTFPLCMPKQYISYHDIRYLASL